MNRALQERIKVDQIIIREQRWLNSHIKAVLCDLKSENAELLYSIYLWAAQIFKYIQLNITLFTMSPPQE